MGELSDRAAGTMANAAGRRDAARQAGLADRTAKRALDVAVSAMLLAVLAIPIAICAVAIKIDSRGPVFYRASRAGYRGRTLRLLKFRKMVDGAAGDALTGVADPRFTRMGGFLARTKLDEVPQLWNVLRGEMSLVGPRPEDPSFVALHPREYGQILTVRPGVTGLCQLAFAKESAILDPSDRLGHYVADILPQKVRLDTLYALTRSFSGDLRILLWTVMPVLLRVDVAVNRKSGDLTVRRRPASSPSRAA